MSAAGRLQTIERLGIIMKFLDAEFVQGFIRMADDGWQQGWHERNGGNLSYRVITSTGTFNILATFRIVSICLPAAAAI